MASRTGRMLRLRKARSSRRWTGSTRSATSSYPTEQARILRLLIERIDVAPDGISVTLHAAGTAASSRSWRTRSLPLWPRPNPCGRPQSNDRARRSRT